MLSRIPQIEKKVDRQEMLMRMCEVSANICLFDCNTDFHRFTQNRDDLIQKYWKWDKYPLSPSVIVKRIKISNIKWYIYNKINYFDKGWNSDFLNGLASCGKVIWNKDSFPTFRWQGHDNVLEILKNSPFTGKFSDNCFKNDITDYRRWNNVSAFCMRYSKNTPHFIAGVLATGSIYKYKNQYYAKYTKRLSDYFNSIGIPIEVEEDKLPFNRNILISIIWPALFSKYMPNNYGNIWLNIKNAYKTREYAPILWKIYGDSKFPTDGIPYLRSRRKIFYDFREQGKTIKTLEFMRLNSGLINLHRIIGECVREWKNNKINGEKLCV